MRAAAAREVDGVVFPDVVVDNPLRGGPFAGKALNDALITVWIGRRPFDAALKEVLLGG